MCSVEARVPCVHSVRAFRARIPCVHSVLPVSVTAYEQVSVVRRSAKTITAESAA